MYPSFFQVLSGEFLKTRRSWGLSLSLLGPAAVSAIVLAYFIKESADFSKSDANLWLTVGRYHFNFFFLLYPLFGALIAFLISNIEHRANGFKQLFALPAPKAYFYGSKLILLLSWMLASLLLATALIYGMGYLLELLYPAMPFDKFSPGWAIPQFMGHMAVSLLAILAIHYFLSIYFDNFIISVGSACFLLVFGMVVASWKYAYLIPYTYFNRIFMVYLTNGQHPFFGAREYGVCLAYAFIFFVGGYYFFSRKEVRS